jgi:hypothetical protein
MSTGIPGMKSEVEQNHCRADILCCSSFWLDRGARFHHGGPNNQGRSGGSSTSTFESPLQLERINFNQPQHNGPVSIPATTAEIVVAPAILPIVTPPAVIVRVQGGPTEVAERPIVV